MMITLSQIKIHSTSASDIVGATGHPVTLLVRHGQAKESFHGDLLLKVIVGAAGPSRSNTCSARSNKTTPGEASGGGGCYEIAQILRASNVFFLHNVFYY